MDSKQYNFQDRIRIKLNGENFSCAYNISLATLIDYLDFSVDKIILEYNHEIVIKDLFNEIFLKDGDNLEIVTIVGGG